MSAQLKLLVSARVRAARERLRLTQEELAARIDRTPESISNIERAKQLPGLGTLADLARVLGVPLTDFLEERGDRKITTARLKLEADLREVCRALSDRDLMIAIRQTGAFLDVDPLTAIGRSSKLPRR